MSLEPSSTSRRTRAIAHTIETFLDRAWHGQWPTRAATLVAAACATYFVAGPALGVAATAAMCLAFLFEFRYVRWLKDMHANAARFSEAEAMVVLRRAERNIGLCILLHGIGFFFLAFAPMPGPIIAFLFAAGGFGVIISQHMLSPQTALWTLPTPTAIMAASAVSIAGGEWAPLVLALVIILAFNVFRMTVAGESAARDLIEARLTLEDDAEYLESRIAERTAELAAAKTLAEEASRAKSAFLAAMSHELRTPLNAVIGYSELMMEDAVEAGRNGDAADLERINVAGRNLLTLIGDVLDMSKIEAGRMELSESQCDIGQLVREIEIIGRPGVEKNRNRLIVDVAAEAGSLIADSQKLKQGILNLVSNAGKFTADGEVRVTVRRDACPSGEEVRITVKDTGIGMDEATQRRLFQPFVQGDSSTTRAYGGTGLGLYIARCFIEMMQGRLTMQSAPGEGSSFTIALPVRTAPMAAAA